MPTCDLATPLTGLLLILCALAAYAAFELIGFIKTRRELDRMMIELASFTERLRKQ